MNRQEAAKLVPILQAFAGGADVQSRSPSVGEQWRDDSSVYWPSNLEYRVKPRPRIVTVSYIRDVDWVHVSLDNTPPEYLPDGKTRSDVLTVEVTLP